MTVNVETLLTIIFVLVDDWYKQYGVCLLQGKRGAKPQFSDSEVITLFMLDTKPVPVVGYKRSKRHSDFCRLRTGSGQR